MERTEYVEKEEKYIKQNNCTKSTPALTFSDYFKLILIK